MQQLLAAENRWQRARRAALAAHRALYRAIPSAGARARSGARILQLALMRPAPTAPLTNAQPKPDSAAAKLPDSMLPSAGESGQGKSSDAQTQSSPSESRGAPSGQTPAPPCLAFRAFYVAKSTPKARFWHGY